MENQLVSLRIISSLKGITQDEWEQIEENAGDPSVIGISYDNYFDLCDMYLEKLGMKHKIMLRAKKLKKYGLAVTKLTEDLHDLESIMDYREVLLEMPKKINKTDIFPAIVKYYGSYIPVKDISVEKYLNLYLDIPRNNG